MSHPLPMGWNPVPVLPHPLDVGTPADEWEGTANPRHPRREVACWVRGNRYVRVCRLDPDDPRSAGLPEPYRVHYGKVADEDADSIDWGSYPDLAAAESRCRILMRLGGRPR